MQEDMEDEPLNLKGVVEWGCRFKSNPNKVTEPQIINPSAAHVWLVQLLLSKALYIKKTVTDPKII